MFSFEGHYKRPRTINYSKEKELGKSDLVENAKIEREKRALNTLQNASALKIQRKYRFYLLKKTKKQNAFIEFQSLIKEFIIDNNNQFIDDNLLRLIFTLVDKLLIFFKENDSKDFCLNAITEKLIRGKIIRDIVNNSSPRSYYRAVSFSLLLRVTARHMSSMPENSLPTIYNMFIRFFEISFETSFEKFNSKDIHCNYFRNNLVLFLIESAYFHNMSTFISRQMLRDIDVSASNYKQTKISYVLKIILRPLEHSIELHLLKKAIIHYINNVFSTPDKYQKEDNHLGLLRLMSTSLLDIVQWNVIVDIIFNNFHLKGTGRQIRSSVDLIYFLLSLQSTIVLNKPYSQDVTKAAAQIVILFFQLSNSFNGNEQMFLSNNISQTSAQDLWVASHDDFDFEMKEIQLADNDNDDIVESSSSEEEEEEQEDEAVEKSIKNKRKNIQQKQKMSIIEQEIAIFLRNKFSHVTIPLSLLNKDKSIDENVLINSIGYVYHLLVLETKIIGSLESKSFILHLVQTSKTVSRRLWNCAVEHRQTTAASDRSVMDSLIKGEIRLSSSEMDIFFGKLLCFANCLHWQLLSVQDLDLISLFSDKCSEVLEFTSEELCAVVLKLRDIMCGLISLIYPSSSSSSSTLFLIDKLTKCFSELQRVVIRLYNRDVRKGLKMSGKRLEWVKSDVCRLSVSSLRNFRHLLLEGDYTFGGNSKGGGRVSLAAADMRQLMILREMPFVVPIGTRLRIFKEMITGLESSNYRHQHQQNSVRIRRDRVYEDAFSQITMRTVPDVRSGLRIEFIDTFGIAEAGIDGGGLLREFLGSVVLAACDPAKGLFVTTTTNLLYPNPEVATLHPSDWQQHLHFVGRMVGLAVSKGLTVEAPFAPFFLQKLFAKECSHQEKENSHSSNVTVDIDNLQSMDEELYRHLLSLKSMPNVEQLGLDFTLSRQCYGVSATVPLKHNGADISVTNDNKIEYIYLVADYKLNRQISKQTAAVAQGLNDVVPIEAFRLFDLDELAVIVTGGEGGATIDIEDLRRNTVYHGLETRPDSSTIIRNFWAVVKDMSEEERRSFVQFVTSLSRAPMLGFGELSPKFAIVIVPDTDRLPTASTCLNLLKLPAYEDLEEMRYRLLYAIGADTGFHLS